MAVVEGVVHVIEAKLSEVMRSARVKGSQAWKSDSKEQSEPRESPLDLSDVSWEYRVYDRLGKVQIRLYDETTAEKIRVIRPTQMLEIGEKMDQMAGKLLKVKA